MQQSSLECGQLEGVVFSNPLIQCFDLWLKGIPDGLVTGLFFVIKVGGEYI